MLNLRYKFWFFFYWLLFAVFSVFEARNPGYVRHPDVAPFPWLGLVIIWLILAGLVTAFYLILLPAFVGRSKFRFGAAIALSFAMFVGSFMTMATDMPGLFYVPIDFSVITFLILLMALLNSTIQLLWGKMRQRI